MMRLARYALTLLRWELRYWVRRSTPWFLRRFIHFVKYDLVELLVILGFAAAFVVVWSWYFL